MIYSSRCEDIEVIRKLKDLEFPQTSLYSTSTYLDTRYQNLVFGDYDELPEYLVYVPSYAEIMDWLLEERGLSIYIMKSLEPETWKYGVDLAITGNLMRAGQNISDEVMALKLAIKSALEIEDKEIQDFIDQFKKDEEVKKNMVEIP
jgi:hypothetical protein